VNLSQSIVHDVDAAPSRIPAFHTEPVEIVVWLMDATYENKSQTEKGTAYGDGDAGTARVGSISEAER